MIPTTPRQLVIGLDAMEWDLVRSWASAGKLPVFRRLMEQGARTELETTAGQLPDTIWACTYTGVNPAKFEKYFYVQYDPGSMGLRHVPDDEITAPPFWELLSEAGFRVGVADAPKFRLSRRINGYQIANWGAHATKTARASNPAPLLADIDARFGRHPVGDCDRVDAKPAALRGLRKRVLDGVRLHGELFRWLMRRGDWDVFFGGFSAPHCIGHHFWHFVDPQHPRYTADDPHGIADSIERVYQAIDREIGEMLALAGAGVRTLIVAGHGMGPLYHASWNLPDMLDLWGYGPRGPAAAGRAPGQTSPAAAGRAPGAKRASANPWRLLKLMTPGWLQYAIKGSLPRRLQDELLFRWYRGGRKWAGARAFAVPNNDAVGSIRVSVRGRDRGGVVDPADYRKVCEDLAACLSELTDPATGRKIVRRVSLSADLFHGPFLDQLPDLTVLWESGFAWNAVHSPRFGALELPAQDGRTGSHTPHGFLIAHGPGVPRNIELKGRSILDIAPTILQSAGAPLPAGLDGTALTTRERLVVA